MELNDNWRIKRKEKKITLLKRFVVFKCGKKSKLFQILQLLVVRDFFPCLRKQKGFLHMCRKPLKGSEHGADPDGRSQWTKKLSRPDPEVANKLVSFIHDFLRKSSLSLKGMLQAKDNSPVRSLFWFLSVESSSLFRMKWEDHFW